MDLRERIGSLFGSKPERRHHYTLVPIQWSEMRKDPHELYYYRSGIASAIAATVAERLDPQGARVHAIASVADLMSETLIDTGIVFGFTPEYYDITCAAIPAVMWTVHAEENGRILRPTLVASDGCMELAVRSIDSPRSARVSVNLMYVLAQESYHIRHIFQDTWYTNKTADANEGLFIMQGSEERQSKQYAKAKAIYEINLGERASRAFALRYLLEKEHQLRIRLREGETNPRYEALVAALPNQRLKLVQAFDRKLNGT